MATNTLSFDGVNVNDVYDHLTKAGLTTSEAGIIAASWIYQNLGQSKRVFDYRQAFPGVEAACMPAAFVRQFAHADWTDGEDVVQAGTTPGEEGFNARFHKIEHDLDHLGADLATAFACMAEMRAELRSLLDEIKTEINRINTDIFNCCSNRRVVIDPGFSTGPNVQLADPGMFKGTMTFMGKRVNVWDTKEGLMMFPAVESLPVDVITGGRGATGGLVGKLIADNPNVKAAFPQAFTAKDFVTKFGTMTLDDGRSVKDALAIVPDGTTFKTTDDLVNDVIDREAGSLKTSTGTTSAVTLALGVDSAANVGTASVTKLGGIPDNAKAALAKAGINTLSDLAGADTKKVADAMKTSGVSATAGDLAAWQGHAKTLTRLGG